MSKLQVPKRDYKNGFNHAGWVGVPLDIFSQVFEGDVVMLWTGPFMCGHPLLHAQIKHQRCAS